MASLLCFHDLKFWPFNFSFTSNIIWDNLIIFNDLNTPNNFDFIVTTQKLKSLLLSQIATHFTKCRLYPYRGSKNKVLVYQSTRKFIIICNLTFNTTINYVMIKKCFSFDKEWYTYLQHIPCDSIFHPFLLIKSTPTSPSSIFVHMLILSNAFLLINSTIVCPFSIFIQMLKLSKLVIGDSHAPW